MSVEILKRFSDRIEFTVNGQYFVEEFLNVKCPECGEITNRIITAYNNTFYIHTEDGKNTEDYCQINRGEEKIPHALLYTLHDDMSVISLVEGLW